MASNKKAQILAAVMCASSIFGSYTVVSAADTPTKIESTDKNSSVTANGSTITATAGAQGSQQSTITLGNKSLAINVGKQTTTDGTTYGTFTLNSSNLAVNNSGLSVKNTKGIVVGSISNTGAITGTGLTVKAVSDPIKPEGNYVESKVTTSGVADTIKQGGFTRATSNVTTNSIKDTIYTDSGTELSSINVFKNTAANGIENGKVSLTAKKIVTDNQTSTTTTSTLTLGGDNASLKVGNYGFTVDSNNNVLFSGKNASLTSTGLTVNGTGTSSIKSTNATTGAMGQSQVSYNGVTDTVTNGTNTTTSTVGATGVTDTVTNASNQTLAQSQVNTAGITLTANKYDEENTKTSSSLSIKGDSATLTSGTAYVKVDNTLGNVTLSGNNATLSGSTFTLKDATNGKTLASLGASGLSINNADGIKVGGISNTGNLIANDGMNVTDKNSSWVNIGTSTMQKDITATTTTSYAGITNKIDTTLAGNKTYTSGTVVGPTSVTTTVQGSTTTDAISGNKNKTTSTVSATGVTDTVYNVKGNQVASSSVTTNGIVNTTTNLSIDGSTNNTMSTSIYQDKRGISASATKKDEDGNTTGGISTTGAVTGTSLIITAENTAGNKTTSTVGATGVTDAVYGTDGARVAYSNVGTGGISNTTSLKTTTGKIDTAINQNTSGIGISSTKYDTNNKVTDKTSLTMNGSANNITSIKYNDSNKTAETTSVSVNGATSSITSYGNYVYGEDGKATSYNQASISLNGNTGTATIRGGSNTASSTLTLNEAGVALSGKNVGLNANGLTLYNDVDGVKTQYASLSAGGLDVKGTGSTTIKSTNATTGAIGQSQVSYNGVTDSFTKDDVTNSVTTNANGTTFLSTGNGSTTIKGDTIKTTNLIVNGKDIGGVATDVAGIDRNTENEDGLGYYTQIEGKTKIYNTGRFSTANGNFVVDPYGSITSKAGNYRFNMDRTSGFDLGYAATTSFTLDDTGVSLGFRNNSFILDKNGATFINANGENVSFTSINGGTITTGETVINGSSITTKDLYVDNIHLNGAITDGNGNVVGGGDLSLGADGTLDLKYNANGITNTFVSGATGVHSSFSNGTTTASSSVGYIDDKNTIGIKDQVGNTSVTTTTDGTTFANGSGSTTINGGNITTTGDVTVGGDLSVGDNFKVDGTTGNVTGGTYNGVQISTDKDGNAIIGGTNIGDLATNEEVNKVNDKVDAVDNKVGDTSKLDKEITDNQNYKDNPNLVGAVNAEADIRRNEISRIDGQIEQLDGRVGSLENRMSDVEDRIDKVGAMSAAIANLRTMGFDPEAPTEIAIGVGQYKSETGLALGVFHYPNQDFMLSASISTSGDEVMGGIGATWKLGRKSAAEKAKDEEARRLEKAEEMKKLAQDAKVKAQAERHAKLLAEREAQKTA